MQTSLSSKTSGKHLAELYQRDFYIWLQTTAKLLREKKLDEIDWENLIEEVESMGRSEKKEIKSCLIVLIEHLLKLQYWEDEKTYNSRGWRKTIVEQRRQIQLSLEDSPSLRNLLDDMFIDCYHKAKKDTSNKYELSPQIFPSEPPFSLEDALNTDYFPK